MERQGENCICGWLRNVVTIGRKNKLLSFLSAEPVCYHFLIYKCVFVSHLTETDRTKNSVKSCSRWQMQYLIIFAENSLASMLCCCLWFWSVRSRTPSVRPPHFGGCVVCSYISAKNSEEGSSPDARQQFPSWCQAQPFLLETVWGTSQAGYSATYFIPG